MKRELVAAKLKYVALQQKMLLKKQQICSLNLFVVVCVTKTQTYRHSYSPQTHTTTH